MRIREYLRNLSAAQAFDFTPYVLAFSTSASLGIIQLQGLIQQPSSRSHELAIVAYAGLAAAVALFAIRKLARRNADPLPAMESKFQFPAKIAALSVQVGILFLPVSVYLAVWQSHYDQLEWYGLGFLDKRYLLSLYWIAVLTVLIFPPLLWRILGAGQSPPAPGIAAEDSPPGSQNEIPSRRRSLLRRYLMLALALLVAYLMYGPPWNLSWLPVQPNFHEQVHLGPLQAIDKGYLPDIGPAAQGYGPGFQLAMYGLMKASGHFTLSSFRGAQATIDFVGYCLFAILAFEILGVPYAFLAVVLSVTVSPFGSIPWDAGGSLDPWGWPNPWRYMGGLVLAVLLSSLLTAEKEAPPKLVTAGFVWGLLVWFSPENLLMGVLSTGLLCTLMWSTHTVTFKRIARGLSQVGAGSLICWLPIAGFYFSRGRLQEYISNVFQVGREVLNGCSNTAVAGNILGSPYLSNIMFFGPPVFVVCGLAGLYKDAVLVGPLDKRRLALLALVCVSLANFFGSLTRTDENHLLNTLISFPILIALIIRDLPGLLGQRPSRILFLRAVVILVVLMFASNYGPEDYRFLSMQASSRVERFFRTAPKATGSGLPQGISLSRMGPARLPKGALYSDHPTITVADLFSALDELHAMTGEKTVFVHSFPYLSPGLVYFLADLTPAPVLVDPTTMVFSSEDRARFVDHFDRVANQVDYLVTTDRTIPEVAAFMAGHPDARAATRVLSDEKFFVFGVFGATGAP